ncbi:hypothetical protein D5F01_LYC14206 [Larimichthys crocea]|uniref:C-type lectin domain-containing protein n=1 Tax=Larimichthys crocea TaxID=215358 RepID=A0A6G0I9I4_LARCR|nr:hypothetical protein D5F01_LYC14206 [Larimichthys crocea]
MFIMKTVLLISVLCVTLSVSAAAAVEVADVEEEETKLAASAVEVADVEKEETELAASDDTADVEPAVLLKVNALRNAVPPPFVQGWHAHEKHCYLMVNLTYAWTNAEGYWRWDDGTPFDYNNWYSHSSSHSYDCLYLNSQDTLGWSNDRCHLGRPFICSIKAIC